MFNTDRILATESAKRKRRQYGGYGSAQQYGNQYQIYGPGGQGWGSGFNNRYPNQPNNGFSNNMNWNQGNRRPEWYYNSAQTVQTSILLSFLSCTCIFFNVF